MKKIYICLFITLSIFFSYRGNLQCTEVIEKKEETVFPSEQQSLLTELEELDAEMQQNGKAIEVIGVIKNISPSILKGFITVYLLDSNGNVINAQDEAIGQGLSFSPGAMAEFTMILKVPGKKKIASVSVDFTNE